LLNNSPLLFSSQPIESKKKRVEMELNQLEEAEEDALTIQRQLLHQTSALESSIGIATRYRFQFL
jgi:hypothetical protein